MGELFGEGRGKEIVSRVILKFVLFAEKNVGYGLLCILVFTKVDCKIFGGKKG